MKLSPEFFSRACPELFIVRGRLVATQEAYTTIPLTRAWPDREEVAHFYCPSCGEVWGERITPGIPTSYHHYYPRTCLECGGNEDMIWPMEGNNLDVLGADVLAYLILKETENHESEIVAL